VKDLLLEVMLVMGLVLTSFYSSGCGNTIDGFGKDLQKLASPYVE